MLTASRRIRLAPGEPLRRASRRPSIRLSSRAPTYADCPPPPVAVVAAEAAEAAVVAAAEVAEAAVVVAEAAGSSPANPQLVRLAAFSTLPAVWADRPDLVGIVTRWVEDVVAQPDERLGRAGPMCPALPGVLRDDTLLVGCVGRSIFTRPDSMNHALASVADQVFRTTNDLACALLAFPGIEPWETRGCVEFAVQRMRPTLVSRGAMIGSFHPYQTRRSRHNRAFQSMRAPTPLIGIRKLFTFDRPSLLDDEDALLAFDARCPDTRSHDRDDLQ